MDNYITVFDFRQIFSAPTVHYLLYALMVIGISILATQRKPMQKREIFVFTGFNGLVLIAVLVVGCLYCANYLHLKKVIDAGHAQIVEGTVSDFLVGPAGKPEHFCVATTCFDIGKPSLGHDAGFGLTRHNGSPIKNGLPVRINYVDNQITKLEVRQDSQSQNQN